MPYPRLAQDVDLGEDAELRRLEGALVDPGAIAPQAAGSCAALREQQASTSSAAALEDQAVATAAADAHGAVVTGYAEYREKFLSEWILTKGVWTQLYTVRVLRAVRPRCSPVQN